MAVRISCINNIMWRIRNRTLFEIKGIASRSNIADSMCLTQKENFLEKPLILYKMW